MPQPVSGFSKKTKEEKIEWLVSNYLQNDPLVDKVLKQYWNDDEKLQKLHDGFIENAISNYYLPFAIAPNFLINNELYSIPMVLEESSVVAAASKSAQFWMKRGGFKTSIDAGRICCYCNFFHRWTEAMQWFTDCAIRCG